MNLFLLLLIISFSTFGLALEFKDAHAQTHIIPQNQGPASNTVARSYDLWTVVPPFVCFLFPLR